MRIANYLRKVAEVITNREINTKPRPRIRLRPHPRAVTSGQGMSIYAELVEQFCSFRPQNIFEIGANYAQDSEYLRLYFGVKSEQVYVFEPHPKITPEIKKYYPRFNVINDAISNIDGEATFNIVDVDDNSQWNTGVSSLKTSLSSNIKYKPHQVKTKRMDTFLRETGIQEIDFLKVDVEGVNYEVIESFGSDLKKVKVIQIEGENKPYWEGQKLFSDLESLLKSNHFTLVYFMLSGDCVQSDSLWIQSKFLKNK